VVLDLENQKCCPILMKIRDIIQTQASEGNKIVVQTIELFEFYNLPLGQQGVKGSFRFKKSKKLSDLHVIKRHHLGASI